MGTVTQRFAAAARAAGARIETGRGATAIAQGPLRVQLRDGSEVRARAVVVNADPFRLGELIGREKLPAAWNTRVDGYRRDGTTLKVNLALRGLPRFTCLPEDRGQFGSTMHLLPDEPEVMGAMRAAFADVKAGRLPEFPTIEWYVHTTVDPSLRDAQGNHNSALFVQWVPYALKGTTWEAEEDRYVRNLLAICDRFAPGTSALVVDTFALSPPKIEQHFGISRGHIHHVDNAFGFADRLPYKTPIEGVYSCSAGCHPAGSVIGAAGHNSAQRVLRDLRLAPGLTGPTRLQHAPQNARPSRAGETYASHRARRRCSGSVQVERRVQALDAGGDSFRWLHGPHARVRLALELIRTKQQRWRPLLMFPARGQSGGSRAPRERWRRSWT